MKVKRTSNQLPDTVATVRELVEGRHNAASQGALVDLALTDSFLALQHADEARRFASAAADPDLAREQAQLEREFRTADRETWPE